MCRVTVASGTRVVRWGGLAGSPLRLRHRSSVEEPGDQVADDLVPSTHADNGTEALPQVRRVGTDDPSPLGGVVAVQSSILRGPFGVGRHANSVTGGLPRRLLGVYGWWVDIHPIKEATT